MTGTSTTLLLDNEAVQALRDSTHRKHKRALAFLIAEAGRSRGGVIPVVPTAVRVEAGWDRRAPGAARINRFRTVDVALERESADRAAAIGAALRVSVADAHLGATIAALTTPCVVLTSDVDDIARIAAHLDVPVRVVAL